MACDWPTVISDSTSVATELLDACVWIKVGSHSSAQTWQAELKDFALVDS